MTAFTWLCDGCGIPKTFADFPTLPNSQTRSHRCKQCGDAPPEPISAGHSVHVTPPDIERMRQLARDGKTIRETARILGWSPRTVREHSRAEGIKFPGPYWTRDEDARLRECIAAGMHRDQIARSMRRTEWAIEGRTNKLKTGYPAGMTRAEWANRAIERRHIYLCADCGRRKPSTEFSEAQAWKNLDRHISDGRTCLRCESESRTIEAVAFEGPRDVWSDDQPIGAGR